jgi:pyruvate/2-oxoglutarate/acetoin dehydrogenase E1 component
MPEVTLVEAVNLALARAMDDDPDVIVLGEDVGVNGGVFRATAATRPRAVSRRTGRCVLSPSAVTSHALSSDADKARGAGCDAYIS